MAEIAQHFKQVLAAIIKYQTCTPDGKLAYTPAQIASEFGLLPSLFEGYAHLTPPPGASLPWPTPHPPRYVFDPMIHLARAQSAVGRVLKHVEYGEASWREDEKKGAVHHQIQDVILKFEAGYPVGIMWFDTLHWVSVGAYQAPGDQVYYEYGQEEWSSGYDHILPWKDCLDQRITAMKHAIYVPLGTEYFPEDNLWWDPRTEALVSQFPGDIPDLEIEFENGNSVYIMSGDLVGNKHKRDPLRILVCDSLNTAAMLDFGIPPEGFIRIDS